MDPKTLSVKWNNLIRTAEDFIETGILDTARLEELPLEEKVAATSEDIVDTLDQPVSAEESQTKPVYDTWKNVCQACELSGTDRQLAGGEGNRTPRLCLLLDPPNHHALAENRPLAEAPRDFLKKWMSAIGLDLDQECYQLPVLLCRTPGNRPPYHEELDACRGRVVREIAELNPSAIMVLGSAAASMMTGSADIASLRNSLTTIEGVPAQVSYSPVQVLDHPELKRSVWDDLKRLKEVLDDPSLS